MVIQVVAQAVVALHSKVVGLQLFRRVTIKDNQMLVVRIKAKAKHNPLLRTTTKGPTAEAMAEELAEILAEPTVVVALATWLATPMPMGVPTAGSTAEATMVGTLETLLAITEQPKCHPQARQTKAQESKAEMLRSLKSSQELKAPNPPRWPRQSYPLHLQAQHLSR